MLRGTTLRQRTDFQGDSLNFRLHFRMLFSFSQRHIQRTDSQIDSLTFFFVFSDVVMLRVAKVSTFRHDVFSGWTLTVTLCPI